MINLSHYKNGDGCDSALFFKSCKSHLKIYTRNLRKTKIHFITNDKSTENFQNKRIEAKQHTNR